MKNLLDSTITDFDFLKTLIPQKPPFVMIGEMKHYSEEKVVSGFVVSKENLLVDNNHLAAPGLIENMAQTVALHTGYKYHLLQRPAPTGYIGAISKVTIHELPEVGEQLVTTVNILHDIMGITLVQATVASQHTIWASSEMKTALAK
ncbi:hypothetical protein [Pareuzebyella sediminis]|uniref:hypothetical protein n=1 Tax=Pareuzebyella sediminis TaxID=2607998 RepID=UPI0011EF3613|nr:hypothetical protein [Pareuzebyella sediminis]